MKKIIDDLISLKCHFERIRDIGWVQSMRHGTTGIGYTFETLIGKPEEDFPIPDYGSIEIKTRFRNSKEDITLFNATPDGDYLYPMKRLYETYSYPDRKSPDFKVFYANISTIPKFAGKINRFVLHVDKSAKKISVIHIDETGKLTNTDVSWSFDFLKEKLERKLKYLAFVKADAKCNFELQYFHYYKITFYALKNFETFIKLIENGIIKTTFIISCYRNGIKKGQMKSHGVAFDIPEENLEDLFVKICDYE